MERRTAQQNKALHKWFSLLSDELNEKGLDMRVVMKDDWSIWWTEESVKNNLWRPIQEAMFNKKSTTELNTQEINKVFEQIMKSIGEKHEVYIPFPSVEETDNYLQSYERNKI